MALATFGELLIVFSTKVNLLYLLYLVDQMLLSASFSKISKNFLRIQFLLIQVSTH